MVRAIVGTMDPTQGVGSVCQLLKLGTEKSAAVYAGASLSADSGEATSRHPCVVG